MGGVGGCSHGIGAPTVNIKHAFSVFVIVVVSGSQVNVYLSVYTPGL